jgi:hypothetical protein
VREKEIARGVLSWKSKVYSFEFLALGNDHEEPVPKNFGRSQAELKDPDEPVPKDFGRSHVSRRRKKTPPPYF